MNKKKIDRFCRKENDKYEKIVSSPLREGHAA